MEDAKSSRYSNFNRVCIVMILSIFILKLYKNFDMTNVLLIGLNSTLFAANPMSYDVWFIIDEILRYSFIVAIFYIFFHEKNSQHTVSFDKGFSFINLLKGFAYVVLIARVFGMFSEYVILPFFKDMGLTFGDNVFRSEITSLNPVDLFVGVVLIAPVFEEYIFRYLFLNKIREYGDATAILATALLFGMMHLNLNQFVYTFPLGLALAYFALKTDSIYISILMHMLFNLQGVLTLIFGVHIATIIGICLTGFLIYGIYLFIKLLIAYAKDKTKPTFDNTIYRTPAFLILLGFCLYFFFTV